MRNPVGIIADWYAKYGIQAIFGPPCTPGTYLCDYIFTMILGDSNDYNILVAMVSVGLVGSYWNLPVFSNVATGDEVSDKTTYNTLVRLSMTQPEMAQALTGFLTYNKWFRVAVVWSSRVIASNSLRSALRGLFPSAQIDLALDIDVSVTSIPDALDQIRDSARSKSSRNTQLHPHTQLEMMFSHHYYGRKQSQ